MINVILMDKPISILHISDFHKRTKDKYKNLLASLKTDSNKYVRENGVPKPNVIIVSGDLVQGGTTEEIKEQYEASLDFLVNLTNDFLNGDKKRVVIVPGNHDVDWNITKQSMEVVKPGRKKAEKEAYNEIVKQSHSVDTSSLYRWSWNNQKVYMIKDKNKYITRFASFREFFNKFYDGLYEYPEDEDYQYTFFDIPDLGVSFLGLNSCYNNDHLNRSGTINSICVANASSEIERRVQSGQLVIGVWHHHTIGTPFEDNYLDYTILDTLVGNGIQLSLHGHQHYCAVAREHTDVYDSRRMLLLSTGSLYGGEHIMSYGASRQYNVITLEEKEEKIKISLYSRADMSSRAKDIPEWGPGLIKGTSSSSWTSEIAAPRDMTEYEEIDSIMRAYESTGDYIQALNRIKLVKAKMPMIRKMILDIMQREEKNEDIASYFMPPITDDEAIALIDAANEINDPELIRKVKELDYIKYSKNPNVINARNRI